MKYEFYAQYPFALKDSVTQAFAIDWLVDKSGQLPHSWPEIEDVRDSFQRITVLSQALLTAYKEQARMGTRREAGGMRFWLQRRAERFLSDRYAWAEDVGLMLAPPRLDILPVGSWSIRFTFTLRKPYLSRDDTDFYILDNPIKKEWVFKVPYVAPSQWKGALRSAMMRDLASHLQAGRMDEEQFVAERLRLYRLFGSEQDGAAGFLNRAWASHRVGPRPEADSTEWDKRFRREVERVSSQFEQRLREHKYRVGDVEGFQGRLHFYPTFFNRIGLEVINPHDRRTSAGKQPIYFECVPQGTKGEFALLYVPLDGAGESEALADLDTVAQGVRAMLTRYGFGAKTSSGYGLARESVSDGLLTVRAQDLEPAPEPTQPERAVALPRYLESPGRLHADLRAADGSLTSEEEYRERIESQGKKYTKKDRQLYRKAKTWWERDGRTLSERGAEPEPGRAELSERPTPTWPSWSFDSFEELISQAGQVAKELGDGS